MWRGEPTYDLEQIQRLIGQGPISSWITITAEKGAALLGLQRSDIIDAVMELRTRHFYKTMASENQPGLWQDVYHVEHGEIPLYIKLQMTVDGRAVVVQFKRR